MLAWLVGLALVSAWPMEVPTDPGAGVTVLLSLTVFQDSVSATMPITSLQIPLLGKPSLDTLEEKEHNNHKAPI